MEFPITYVKYHMLSFIRIKKNITQFVFSMFTKSAVPLSFPTTLVLSKRVKHGNVKARMSFGVLRNYEALFRLSYRKILFRFSISVANKVPTFSVVFLKSNDLYQCFKFEDTFRSKK